MLEADEPRIENKVPSPDGATFKIEQDLFDAAIPDGALVITVHALAQGSAGNVWMRTEEDKYLRLMKERILPGEPSKNILHGEVNRYAYSQQAEIESGDMRTRLTILALKESANRAEPLL